MTGRENGIQTRQGFITASSLPPKLRRNTPTDIAHRTLGSIAGHTSKLTEQALGANPPIIMHCQDGMGSAFFTGQPDKASASHEGDIMKMDYVKRELPEQLLYPGMKAAGTAGLVGPKGIHNTAHPGTVERVQNQITGWFVFTLGSVSPDAFIRTRAVGNMNLMPSA